MAVPQQMTATGDNSLHVHFTDQDDLDDSLKKNQPDPSLPPPPPFPQEDDAFSEIYSSANIDISDEAPGYSEAAYRVDHSALMRKIDMKLLPFLCLCYLLSFMDRTNISHSLETLEPTLHISHHQQTWCILIFFIGYILFEIPSNLLFRFFGPRIWLSRIVITSGIMCFSLGFVNSFESLMAARFLLGAFEAGFYPGVIFYLTFWYKSNERAFRIALLVSSSIMAGIIGYLLAYSINSRLNGFEGREAWRWIFLLEGIPTALIGALALFYLPDYPQTARFLKPPEREACMIRLRDVVGQRDTNDGEHPHFDSKELVATLSDFKIYLFAIGNFFKGFNLYSFTHAFPTLLIEMIPMLLIAIASVLTLSWISDRYKNRVIPIIFCAILQLLGFVGMSSFHKADGKYFISIVITCIGVYSGTPSYLTWVTTHYVGSTRTAFATALVLCFGSLGALTSPLASPITTGKEHYLETFKENSPVYIVNWVFASLIIVNTLLLNFLLSNRLRLQHVDQKQQLDQHQVNR